MLQAWHTGVLARNDQARFDITVKALAPDLNCSVHREYNLNRGEELESLWAWSPSFEVSKGTVSTRTSGVVLWGSDLEDHE
jgi:argininosuccinate synthase